jgi:hypothetical protein
MATGLIFLEELMMKNLGKFKLYEPESPDIPGAKYVRNEDSVDWYSLVWDETRIAGNVYVGTDDEGSIVCVTDDGSSLFPVDMTVWEIPANEAPNNILTEGYDAKIIDGVYSIDSNQILKGKQQNLLTEAERNITPLARAVKYGMATDDETAKLEAWEKYSVLVSRVKLGDEWPEKPA